MSLLQKILLNKKEFLGLFWGEKTVMLQQVEIFTSPTAIFFCVNQHEV